MDLNCYCLVDPRPETTDEDRKIVHLCVECRNEHYPDHGWFWEGSKEGYGPWEFKCFLCGKILHDPANDEMVEVDEDVWRSINGDSEKQT